MAEKSGTKLSTKSVMAKEDTVVSEKKKALELALNKIEKDFGRGAIMTMGKDFKVEVDAISTGAIGLDLALGVNGIPRGRIIEIYGPESVSYTHLTLPTKRIV